MLPSTQPLRPSQVLELVLFVIFLLFVLFLRSALAEPALITNSRRSSCLCLPMAGKIGLPLCLASLPSKYKQGFSIWEEEKALRYSVFLHILVVSPPVPLLPSLSLDYKVYSLGHWPYKVDFQNQSKMAFLWKVSKFRKRQSKWL